MKRLIFILFYLWFGFIQAQKEFKYKLLTDSVFGVDDKIIAPLIFYQLSEAGESVLLTARDSVDRIALFLINHPQLKIEIGSHTDSRGDKNKNLDLSKRRAELIKNYLVKEKHIDECRIGFKGYGGLLPLISINEINSKKSLKEKEKLYSKNRRTEIKIVLIKKINYTIVRSLVDKSKTNNKTLLVFKFVGPDGKSVKSHVKLALNNDTIIPEISDKGIYSTFVDTGIYKLNFCVPFWYDIKIDTLVCFKNEKIKVTVFFSAKEMKSPQVLYNLGKPAIYVYPTQKTKVDLSLNVKGKMTFSYPFYKNGWTFTADPSSNINYNNRNYNYLFWEGEQELGNLFINWKEGFNVSSDTIVSFFEHSLSKAGLNEKEMQDFITFWVPKMQINKKNYVHFMFTNDYDQLATININPKPENLIRVFVLWSKIENINEKVKPQVFPTFNRKGFTVIEWGGSEMDNILNLIDKINN